MICGLLNPILACRRDWVESRSGSSGRHGSSAFVTRAVTELINRTPNYQWRLRAFTIAGLREGQQECRRVLDITQAGPLGRPLRHPPPHGMVPVYVPDIPR
eukprot:scaffold42788_cov47-Prasinocladus_malaysianus.AAC.3